MTSRTPMLNLYRNAYHFAEALRCADYACATKSEMRFVLQMRFRYAHHHPRMKMTMQEHQRLTALAIEGGWDGRAIEEERVRVECSA